MKKTILCFAYILVVLSFAVPNANAETIYDIIPSESDFLLKTDEESNQLSQSLSFGSIIDFIIKSLKDYFPDFFEMVLSTLVLVLLFSLIDRLSFDKNSKSSRFALSCIISAVLTLSLIAYFTRTCVVIEKNVETIRVFCDASVPIISALMIESGKSFGSVFFGNAISLSGALSNGLNAHIFMPLIRIYLAVGCCGSVWDDINLSEVTELIQKFIKWLIGIVFSIFTFTLSIQNLLAKSADNIAQKMIKNAAGSVPYMGGVLSKGIDGAFVIASGTKNTSSVIGIAVIVSIFIGPASLLVLQSIALYITMYAAKLFGQKETFLILKTAHKAYLLMLGLFLVSVLMCIVCFLMICLGAN